MDEFGRSLSVIGFCFVLLVLQSMFSTISPGPPWAPQLVLTVIVHYGLLQEVHLVRGMAIAFASGYLLDVFSGNPMSLHTFMQCASFLAARGLGLRLFLRNVPLQAVLAFVASLAAQGTSLAIRAIFEESQSPFEAHDTQRVFLAMASSATTTAVLAPLVFAVVGRIESTETGRSEEGSVNA